MTTIRPLFAELNDRLTGGEVLAMAVQSRPERSPFSLMRPTVSCICATGKDSFHVEHFLPAAIECFRRQTYPAGLLQLILVSPCELPAWTTGPRIKAVLASEAATLGELRNVGLDAAGGEYCIQWDDDDWHHPERIEK